MLRTKLGVMLALFWGVLGVSGCGGGAQESQTTDNRAGVIVALEPMRPSVVGVTVLTVKLSTPDGLPVTDAQRVAVKGVVQGMDMNPVLGVAEEAINGDYRIAFEWTAEGEWLLTVDVTLADNTTLTREFSVTIPSQ